MIPQKNRQKFYDRFGEVYYLRAFDFLPEPIANYPENLKYSYILGCLNNLPDYGRVFQTRREAAEASNRVRETLGLPKWDSSDWVKGGYAQDYGLHENEVANEELREWLSKRKEEQGKAEVQDDDKPKMNYDGYYERAKEMAKPVKCGECPFYHEDKDIPSNSYCRHNGGWGWGLKPDQDCEFKHSLNSVQRLYTNAVNSGLPY